MSGLVLITRPLASALPLKSRLAAGGWKSFIEPMMTIEPLAATLPDLDAFQGLVFTSAHGVEAFASASPHRDLPVWAVGGATAAAAREQGFAVRHEGPGSIEELNEELRCNGTMNGLRLLHPSGRHTAGTLSVPGAAIEQLTLYHAVAAREISPACLDYLDRRHFTAALFYSSRTAEIFVNLLRKHVRTEMVSTIKALCISNSVVKSLADLPWQDVRVAGSPAPEDMLALLDCPFTENFKASNP